MGHKQESCLPEEIIPSSIEYHVHRISNRSRVIYMIILVIMLISLGALPFIYVDIIISSPGMVHAGIEPQSLYAPSTGMVIQSRIKAYEQVQAGDTLLMLDTRAKCARLKMLSHQKNENKLAIRDLNSLIASCYDHQEEQQINLQLPVYISEHIYFARQYQHHQTTLKKVSNDHERAEHLFLNDVLPETDYEMARHALEQEKALTEAWLLQQLRSWQHDASRRTLEQARLAADIQQLKEEISRCYLVAPVNGTITLSSDVQVGSQLFSNQPIAELSPEGELFITASVSPADIGYLFRGQTVRVAVDAYNHHLWGLLDASILEISDDIIADPVSHRPYYRIRCRLSDDFLVHTSGSVAYLRKGMTVTCRMVKTRKSLLHLLVNRLDHLFNPANHHRK